MNPSTIKIHRHGKLAGQYTSKYLAKRHGISCFEARVVIAASGESRKISTYYANVICGMPMAPESNSKRRAQAFAEALGMPELCPVAKARPETKPQYTYAHYALRFHLNIYEAKMLLKQAGKSRLEAVRLGELIMQLPPAKKHDLGTRLELFRSYENEGLLPMASSGI